jgi:small GTP-binding protein
MQDRKKELKVVLLGDSGVGKTSLIARYAHNTFTTAVQATSGAAFVMKVISVQGEQIGMNIWDTAGQERYHSLARVFYRDAAIIVLVYDITHRESFVSLSRWAAELHKYGPAKVQLAICGNKEDRVSSEAVSMEEAKSFAKSLNAFYCKTSAKSDYGVNLLFTEMASRSLVVPERQSLVLHSLAKKEKSSCC